MRVNKLQCVELEQRIEAFVSSACAGELEAMRAAVARGFDVNGADQIGDTILERVIGGLDCCPEAPRYRVVQEMLRLGADPCRRSGDGSNPLFSAVLKMDTEMLRILLDAGADPNAMLRIMLGVGADSQALASECMEESLYDWADFAYRHDVWNSKLPEEARAADRADQDAWLCFLDRLAVKYGKRRPDHLRLLRERGALAMSELRQQSERCSVPAPRGVPPINSPIRHTSCGFPVGLRSSAQATSTVLADATPQTLRPTKRLGNPTRTSL